LGQIGVGTLLAGVKKGLAVLDFLQPLLGIGQEAVDVGPGLVQDMLRHPFRLFPRQGWVRRPDGGRDPLARRRDDLRGLVVCPGQDFPRRLPRPHLDLLGFVGCARADDMGTKEEVKPNFRTPPR
jgi:hypothetical protein